MKRVLTAFLFFVLILPLFAQTSERPTIAVLDVVPEGVSQLEANLIYEYILDKMNRSSNFSLVERAELDKALKELEISSSGLIDESTAAEIGKITGAEYVLITSILKVNDLYHLSMRVVNVETSRIENTAVEKTDNLDEINELTELTVAKLFDLDEKSVKKPSKRTSAGIFGITADAGVAIPVADVTRVMNYGGSALIRAAYEIKIGTGSLGTGILAGALVEPTLSPGAPGSDVADPYTLLALPLFAQVDYSIPLGPVIFGVEAGGGLLFNLAIFTGGENEFGLSAGLDAGISVGFRITPAVIISLWGDFLMVFIPMRHTREF